MELNVIRRVQFVGSSTGLDKAANDLNRVADAQANIAAGADPVAVATDNVARKVTSTAGAFNRLAASLTPVIRDQAAFERGVKTVNSAVEQGVVTNERAARVVQALAEKYDIATRSARAAGDAFRSAIDAQFQSSGKSARESALAFVPELERLGELRAQQIGRQFREDLDASFRNGGKSAADSASVFASNAAEVERLRAQIDPLGAAQASYNAELARYNVLAETGQINAIELAQAQALAQTRFANTSAALGQLGGMSSRTKGQLQQLSFQMNDVATMSLSGASAFQIFATQAGQFVQVAQMGDGGISGTFGKIASGIAAAGRAALALVTPLNATVAGLGALGTGLYLYATSGQKQLQSVDDALAQHADFIKQVRDAYGEAAVAADIYGRDSLGGLISGQDDIISLQDQLRSKTQDLLMQTTIPTDLGGVSYGPDVVAIKYRAFAKEIEDLRASAERGTPDMKAFRDTIQRMIVNEAPESALRKLGKELLDATKEAGGLDAALKRSMATLDNVTSGAAQAAARLGLFSKALAELNDLAKDEKPGTRINRLFDDAVRSAPGLSGIQAAQAARDAARNKAAGDIIKPFGDRLREQTIENETLGMAAGAAEAYRAKLDLLYEADKKIIRLTKEERDAIADLTKAYGDLLLAKQRTQMESDLGFDRSQIGRNPIEQSVATSMRGIFGDDYAKHMNDTLAGTIRQNAALKVLDDTNKSAADSSEKLALQLRLVGQPEGIKALANAMLEAEQRIRALGVEGTTAADRIREIAAANAVLNEQIRQRQAIYDAAKGDRAELEKLQLEVELIGQSEAVRRRRLAVLEAEQRIRDGVFSGGVADDMRTRAGVIADTTTLLERQSAAWQEIQNVGSAALDSVFGDIVSGNLSLETGLGLLKDIGKELATLAIINPLKNEFLGGNLPALGDVLDRLQGKKTAVPAGLTDALASTVATMSVSAAVVNITGGLGAGLPGIAAAVNDNAGGSLGAAAKAIRTIESGSAAGNYSALGPITRTGDRAYGAYQVMGANIPQWTKTHFGQSLSPSEFLANQQAQDAVFQGQFGGYMGKYGPAGAAQAWFGGPGSVGKIDRTDVLGTSVGGYGSQFSKLYENFGKAGDAASKMAMAANDTAKATGTLGSGLNDLSQNVTGAANAIGKVAGGAGGSIGGIAASVYAGLGAPAQGGIYAKGGVFDAGNVIPFARGGIVSSPTVFPMANGMGLMGEAGPEAVMPLKRGRGGRLGVEMDFGPVARMQAPSPEVKVTFIDQTTSGTKKVTQTETRGPGGQREVQFIMEDTVAQAQARPGSPADLNLRQRGASPRRAVR